MKRISQLGGGILWLLAFLLFGVVTASAKSVDYQALKYGTNQTSMASGYFVHPAKVTVAGGKYRVVMDIKTAKNLSSFPVKVLSVAGGQPAKIKKVKDKAGNSHLFFSFYTANLRRRVNAKLAIDVPKVYKAHHFISFKFKANELPSIAKPKTETAHARKSPVVKVTTHKRKVANQSKPTPKVTKQKKRVAKKQSQPAKSNNNADKQSKPAKHHSTQSDQPKEKKNKSNSPKDKKATTQKKVSKKSPTKKNDRVKPSKEKKKSGTKPLIISSAAAGVILVGLGGYLFYRHKR
ncbi:NEAT domain-containing protein [Lentilactobacillus sp. Marseille-Q4993]|uniref:NEAT domain-containing protein n=1 Tax=Lentilactobacillus sp. Marseille-Q4993 TaxID=3039492 RepID=UPI0024BD2D17|nr:NEAT domain-containing protein [Lentilactobacillus sp. Marseille-Q4993]